MKPARPRAVPPLRIEAVNEWAWCGPDRLPLTPRAFALLRHLVEHAGQLVTKDDLFAAIWRDAVVSDAALASCIRDLRRALGDSAEAPRYIETVHRRGFRFIGPLDTGAPGRDAGEAPSSPAALPALVGREGEIAALLTRLERARDGHRHVVFVTGEPGIGKTALVEEFLARVAGDDPAVRIGRGQCVELYGSGEAYLPLLEALGRLGRAAGGEQVVQVLRRHAPTWLTQLPALLADADLEAVQRRAQGATRERMLRELVEALEALSAHEPLVVMLEDLHWSDASTIDLLARLAGRRELARLLVLATYRPADAAAGAHPLRRVMLELQMHGQCEEMALDFLSPAAVAAYLSQRFPRHAFSSELALVLHRMTGGNPLFVVNTVDDLIARGQVRERDGTWELSVPATDVAAGASGTLWQLVDKQVERLTADERAVLAVASVAGVEFSAAVASAAGIGDHDAERVCEALARRGQFLRGAGVAEWPDGTVAGRYAFIHALYQQVLYARVSLGEQVGLHLRTGERLERGYGARAGEIAGELATHFEHGRNFPRAVRYRTEAAGRALSQHAYGEAAAHAARGLDVLRATPESAERAQQELALQVLLGAALTPTQGYAVPEVARTYARARELCEQVGDTAQLFPVLLGLARFYVVRAEFGTARGIARQLVTMAEATRDPASRLAAHNALGVASFYAGEFEAARDHLERGIALYDARAHGPHRSLAFRLGQDPGVSCTTHAALALWMLGYPARAAAQMQEAFALARSLDHPFSVAYACHFATGLYQWRRDREAAQRAEDEALALDTEHGFGLFLTAGSVQRGWVLAGSGRGDEGLAQMRDGIAKHREIGAEVLVPAFLALVAEVHGQLGQRAEGLAAVAEAFAAAQQSGQHYWEAELHRLRGELVRSGEAGREGGAGDAESCFLEALDVARRQKARSLELRAATSLSRLWAERGRAADAQTLLAGIYGWFTEGFDTPDLRDAKSLLEALERGAGESPAGRRSGGRGSSSARAARPRPRAPGTR